MRRYLSGKVVWITGASSGIGRALALETASRGARLVLSGRRAGALEEVAAECRARGAEAAVLAFDLEAPEARASACSDAPLPFGRIDAIVLNAGVSQRSLFMETAPEAFDRVMRLDFDAQVDLVRRMLPAMAERGSGCLLAVSSIAGLAGAPLRPAYSSAKHALAGLFQNLRAELYGTGLRIVTAYPGYVRTRIARNALDAGGRPTGAEDPNIEGGADPARVARRMARSLAGGRVEYTVGFDAKARFGLFLSRYLPAAWAALSRRHAGLV